MRATSSSGLETCVPALPITKPRHPAGFVAVCISIGCERFSSNLLLSVLLLYLNERAGFSAAQATHLIGYFVGGTYFMALLGGLLVDRGLGPWGAGMVGTALAAAGYAALVADGPAALLGGLGLIVLGAGTYKASPQALTDRLYGPADAGRDGGFSLLYLVINLGAFCGPLLGELVRTRHGFRGVFALGGVGLVASHLSLVMGHRHLRMKKIRQEVDREPPVQAGAAGNGVLVRLCLVALLFAVAQLQTSGTLLLWARDHTNRHLGGREVPVSYFAAVPALLIVVLSPAVTLGFTWLRRHEREPSTAGKLQLGMLLTALAYVPLVAAALLSPGRASLGWLLGCLVGLALGELLVSALGPALLTRQAPPHRRALWLSVWFAAIALGCVGAGKLGALGLPAAQYFALMLVLPLAGIGLCGTAPTRQRGRYSARRAPGSSGPSAW